MYVTTTMTEKVNEGEEGFSCLGPWPTKQISGLLPLATLPANQTINIGQHG